MGRGKRKAKKTGAITLVIEAHRKPSPEVVVVHTGKGGPGAQPEPPKAQVDVPAKTKKKKATVKVVGGVYPYDGAAHAATGSVTGPQGEDLGLPTLSYDGAADAPVAVKSYAVVGTFAGNEQYEAAQSTEDVQLVISKAALQLTVSADKFTYDGQDHAATATARGVHGVDLGPPTVTYNGQPTLPRAAGSYAVSASHPGDPNHAAPPPATATLVIAKAPVQLAVTGGTFTYDGQDHPASATAQGVNGLLLDAPALTYNGQPTLPRAAGSYAVRATHPGDANHAAPEPASATLVIDKAAATVTVSGVAATYDGQPHPASGKVTGANGAELGMPTFTYAGKGEVPVDAGSYDVAASFAGDANHGAAAAPPGAQVVIARAAYAITWPPAQISKYHLGRALSKLIPAPSAAQAGRPEFIGRAATDVLAAGTHPVDLGYVPTSANHQRMRTTISLVLYDEPGIAYWMNDVLGFTRYGSHWRKVTKAYDGKNCHMTIFHSAQNQVPDFTMSSPDIFNCLFPATDDWLGVHLSWEVAVGNLNNMAYFPGPNALKVAKGYTMGSVGNLRTQIENGLRKKYNEARTECIDLIKAHRQQYGA